MYKTCRFQKPLSFLQNGHLSLSQNNSIFIVRNPKDQRRDYSVFNPTKKLLLHQLYSQRNTPVTFLITRNESSSQLPSVPPTDTTFFKYISDSSAVAYIKDLIINFHDASGLPWWVSIITLTFLLRACITLPLAVYQNLIFAKIENLSALEMPDIAKDVKKNISIKAKQLNWTGKEASLNYRREVKKQWDALIVRDNCHPFKGTITLWVQIPTWICFSSALRNLAYMLPIKDAAAQIAFLQLSVGGFLWIPNLVQPDGTLILPLLLGMSNLAIIEIQSMIRLRESTKLQTFARNFFRCFSIALIPISATVPSCVVLYWTTSSLLGLGQNLLLISNRFRTLCKIPDTPSTLDHPYLQLLAEIKQKGKFFQRAKK